eukprot:TRINITY_DN14848_c0_g1_i1.p1 TRINITY_DN14848_c0_g1~~TRINITY_DN14848_c0_g1_i1.p1  ORF type:complete len:563 (+),score=136.14 TRINITY_DN14848_c0_g1_i1:697-2385(+)
MRRRRSGRRGRRVSSCTRPCAAGAPGRSALSRSTSFCRLTTTTGSVMTAILEEAKVLSQENVAPYVNCSYTIYVNGALQKKASMLPLPLLETLIIELVLAYPSDVAEDDKRLQKSRAVYVRLQEACEKIKEAAKKNDESEWRWDEAFDLFMTIYGENWHGPAPLSLINGSFMRKVPFVTESGRVVDTPYQMACTYAMNDSHWRENLATWLIQTQQVFEKSVKKVGGTLQASKDDDGTTQRTLLESFTGQGVIYGKDRLAGPFPSQLALGNYSWALSWNYNAPRTALLDPEIVSLHDEYVRSAADLNNTGVPQAPISFPWDDAADPREETGHLLTHTRMCSVEILQNGEWMSVAAAPGAQHLEVAAPGTGLQPMKFTATVKGLKVQLAPPAVIAGPQGEARPVDCWELHGTGPNSEAKNGVCTLSAGGRVLGVDPQSRRLSMAAGGPAEVRFVSWGAPRGLSLLDKDTQATYYDTAGRFYDVCKTKHRWDQSDVFSSRFTVPPLPPVDAPDVDAPLRAKLQCLQEGRFQNLFELSAPPPATEPAALSTKRVSPAKQPRHPARL